MRANRCLFVSLILGAVVCAAMPNIALAQAKSRSTAVKSHGHEGSDPVLTASASITLTKDMRNEIRSWYSLHPVGSVEALPPGIRKRLARGKPLPPGIAQKFAPAGLRSRIHLPNGYQIVEVGLDVLLVEVATSIVHDILMDAVR
jgi:hypothetical protein